MTSAAAIVDSLRESFNAGISRPLETRRTQLQQLQRLLSEQEEAIFTAMAADLGKPPFESYSAEIALVKNEIKAALKNLDVWCAATKVKLPLSFKPGSAEVVAEPLGVVLIIAPWNYPVQLLLAPLVAALAAGNTVVLKPSE